MGDVGERDGMEFLCLCMSPAIDATLTLPVSPRGAGEVIAGVGCEVHPGGKGLNVARWLATRGERVGCGGLLGADNAAAFERELRSCGVEDLFVRVPGETRRNEMLVWRGGSVKLNSVAFPDLAALPPMEELFAKVPKSGGAGVVVLSGSLPAAAGADFYARAIAHFKKLGWTTVLDASGEAFRLGLEAEPDVVKPNSEECAAALGFTPTDPEGFTKADLALRRKARHAIISDGAGGAWFDGEFFPAPRVEVLDTTAAGDTLLAEWCHCSYGRGKCDAATAACRAVAAGSAACTMPGGAPPPSELVERLAAQMQG